jgi:general secretion pathway protein C
MRPRSIAPVAVAALALSAWLHARGVSALVGAGLQVPHVPPAAGPPAVPPAPPPRSADPILARNAFDSTTGPLLPPGDPSASPAPAPPQAEAECADVRVLAISAAADPAWSLALIGVKGEREPRLRAPGGDVLAIAPTAVEMMRDGAPCVARMFRGAGQASTPPPPPPPSPAASVRGVVSTGPGSYAVDRGARDAIIDGAADWMKSVAVRPEKNGDEVVGLRIATLRPGTALDALGVRAGDVVQAVDRVPLTSPEKMLEALGRARTAEHLSVVLLRDGKPVQLDFDVR